jgi:AcrR family transcriptional regulator
MKSRKAAAPEVTPAKTRARRMSAAEREEAIVEGAIQFFAEVGFDGQTRELAQRLGITQPLIFRYFPTKDDLIERIYQRLYVGRWNPRWEAMVRDRSRPLKLRLIDTYIDYATNVLTRDWVRIFLFSGLKGSIFNKRYIALIGQKLIRPICEELAASSCAREMPAAQLAELVWGLHGSIFYMGVRKFVYELDIPAAETTIPDLIGAFLDNLQQGAPQQGAPQPR